MEVTAQVKKSGKSVTVNYDIPEDLDGLRAKFGDEVVAGRAHGAIVIDLQAFLRRKLEPKEGEAEPSAADIQAAVAEWKPGTRAASGPKKSNAEKIGDLFANLSAEEKAKILASLTA